MKKLKHFSGQSLIEFVLIFPIAFFLITGFLDLGRAVFYYSSLTNAVREGTRYAIVNKTAITDAQNNPTDNIIQDKVLEYAFGLANVPNPLLKENIVVIISNPTISIEATYTFQPVTPGISLIFGNSTGIDLVAQSTMRIAGASR